MACYKFDLPVSEIGSKILPSPLVGSAPRHTSLSGKNNPKFGEQPLVFNFFFCIQEFLVDLIAHVNLFILRLICSHKN